MCDEWISIKCIRLKDFKRCIKQGYKLVTLQGCLKMRTSLGFWSTKKRPSGLRLRNLLLYYWTRELGGRPQGGGWRSIWGLDSSHQPTSITMKSKWVKHDLHPQHAQTEDFTWWLSLSFDVYFGLWYSLLLPLTWINSPEETNTNLFVYPSLFYPYSFSTHLPMFGTVLLGEFQNFLFGLGSLFPLCLSENLF